MPRSRPTTQISFAFDPPPVAGPPPAIPPGDDPLALRIVAAGLAPNDAVLAINMALSSPDRSRDGAPWSLPSRLFAWPISYEPGTPDAPGVLRLRHPALVDHPGVLAIREAIPEPAFWGSPQGDEGYGAWYHAVDLMTPDHWRDLLATRRFTDDRKIAVALANAMLTRAVSGKARERWTTRLAREILSRIDAPEPPDRSRGLLAGDGLSPARIEARTVPNIRPRDARAAWIAVHGIEDGYLAYGPGGWLGVTAAGLALRT